MFPPPRIPPSVQVAGVRDPTSTADFNRRAKEKGVVDLTDDDRSSSGTKRKAQEYSTTGGQRKKNASTTNLSRCCHTLQERWNEGAFRWVHKGMYRPDPRILGDDGGPQNGELCVVKEFKTGSVYEESFFNNDIKAVDKAAEFIVAFNALNATVSSSFRQKPILLNRPAVWQSVYPDATGRMSKKLVEPMLEGSFLKFNSNSGYSNGADYMQALSHFSYQHSNGKYLLCDLQGGHYQDAYVLTDPVIMSSSNEKQFGATDLGSEGISNFFAHHKCNQFCRHAWKKPSCPQISSRIPRLASTSMSLTVGSKKSVADRKQTLDAILAKANGP